MTVSPYAGATEHESISSTTFAFQLTATGTTQANAGAVPTKRNVYSVVASGAACLMGAAGRATEIKIMNQGANTLTVFPPGGWSFNNGTVNASVTVAVGTQKVFWGGDPGSATWWTA